MRMPPSSILLVEGSFGDAGLVRLALGTPSPSSIVHVTTAAAAVAALGSQSFSAMVMDLSLLDGSGVSAVRRLRRHAKSLPIVALSIIDDERLALSCLDAGADDFVCKRELPDRRTLRLAIAKAVRRRRRLASEVAPESAPSASVPGQGAGALFISVLSHELRTPVGAITNYAQCLGEEVYGSLSEAQHTAVGGIADCARHLRDMVDDILDISRIEAGHVDMRRADVDVGALCRAAVDAARSHAGRRAVNVSCEVVGEIPSLHTDAAKLRQVLLNLLTNALKFTTQGEVKLTARLEPSTGALELAVSDTGVGIAEEHGKRIFEPFFQVPDRRGIAASGSGLGLCISERLVHVLGGSIGLESTVGRGSRFTISLPAHPPESMASAVGQ